MRQGVHHRRLTAALLGPIVVTLVALGPAAAPAAAAAPSPAPATAAPATSAPAAGTAGATSAPAAGSTAPAATSSAGAGSPDVPLPAGPGTAPVSSTAPSQPLSGRGKAAAVLGGLLLIGVLWAFSQGYGLLGGRARPRAMAGRDRLA